MSAALAFLFVALFSPQSFQDAASLNTGGRTAAPVLVWGDFDRDQLEDCYALDQAGKDRLLRNLGDGSFQDVLATPQFLRWR